MRFNMPASIETVSAAAFRNDIESSNPHEAAGTNPIPPSLCSGASRTERRGEFGLGVAGALLESAAWKPKRPGAIAAAVGLNIAFGAVLVLCFRLPRTFRHHEVVTSLIWIPMPQAKPAMKPEAIRRAALPSVSKRPRVKADALSVLTPSAAPMIERPSHAPIDWWSEADRVVAEAGRAARDRSGSALELALRPRRSSGPAHHTGEQYRTATGAKIVWINDRCYVESDPPPLGTPQALSLGHAGITRTVCPGSAKSDRGDLFKELPAYRKYHPQ